MFIVKREFSSYIKILVNRKEKTIFFYLCNVKKIFKSRIEIQRKSLREFMTSFFGRGSIRCHHHHYHCFLRNNCHYRALLFPGSQLLLLLRLTAEIFFLSCRCNIMAFSTSPEMTQRANNDYHVRRQERGQSENLVFLLKRQSSILVDDNRQSAECISRPFDRAKMHHQIVSRCSRPAVEFFSLSVFFFQIK